MARKTMIEVMPVFSLKEVAEYLTPAVSKYIDSIEQALQEKYADIPRAPRLVSVEMLHVRLRKQSALYPIRLQKALYVYYERLVPTPFLIGLVRSQNFLRTFEDIQSIEIFEDFGAYKDTCLFKNDLRRSSQLCLRRQEARWVIDISTYVSEEKINATGRESGTTIKVLSFIEEKVQEEEVIPSQKEKDLSEKAIG